MTVGRPARGRARPPRPDHAGVQRDVRRRDRRRPGRLQAGRGGAPAVGLPRRHPGRPGGGGVPRLRGARLGRRARRPGCATARTAPAWCSVWQEPDDEQARSTLVREGEVPDGLAARLRRPRRRTTEPVVAGPRGHRAAAPDGGLRRRRQQRRPQGRARARDDRRAPVRRRPRRHLPHRPQAAHRAVGLARRAARPTRRRRPSRGVREALGGELGRRARRAPHRPRDRRRSPAAATGCCRPRRACPRRAASGPRSRGRPF